MQKKRRGGKNLSVFSAQDETRTHTILRPLPPQSSVYTNFTTCAWVPRTGLEPAHLAACAPETHRHLGKKKERKTRLELATPTLARLCSTN